MNKITVFAGPCSVESPEQFEEAARCVAGLGLHWIRGGAFKLRQSPKSFQGLGEEALRIMDDAAGRFGLDVLTEIIDPAQCDLIDRYAQGFQIGTRNMANYALLKAVGAASACSGKLVFLKRGMAATVQEWLTAAEYLTAEGARNIMLCERGIRTFETSTRFTLDISAVPVVHRQSILPICVDVSHAAGQRDLVPALAKAAVAAGCDALMLEVHPNPASALSDGPQQLTLAQFERLMGELRVLAAALGREIV